MLSRRKFFCVIYCNDFEGTSVTFIPMIAGKFSDDKQMENLPRPRFYGISIEYILRSYFYCSLAIEYTKHYNGRKRWVRFCATSVSNGSCRRNYHCSLGRSLGRSFQYQNALRTTVSQLGRQFISQSLPSCRVRCGKLRLVFNPRSHSCYAEATGRLGVPR